eukprot:3768040-Amphidinium_carterae.1
MAPSPGGSPSWNRTNNSRWLFPFTLVTLICNKFATSVFMFFLCFATAGMASSPNHARSFDPSRLTGCDVYFGCSIRLGCDCTSGSSHLQVAALGLGDGLSEGMPLVEDEDVDFGDDTEAADGGDAAVEEDLTGGTPVQEAAPAPVVEPSKRWDTPNAI